jgi:hypothetical protein
MAGQARKSDGSRSMDPVGSRHVRGLVAGNWHGLSRLGRSARHGPGHCSGLFSRAFHPKRQVKCGGKGLARFSELFVLQGTCKACAELREANRPCQNRRLELPFPRAHVVTPMHAHLSSRIAEPRTRGCRSEPMTMTHRSRSLPASGSSIWMMG